MGEGTSAAPQLSQTTASAVQDELIRVLSSHEFRTSKRCQEFLKYVVETTLHGQGDTLKERTIGVDVFGRPASYDPSEDATVRVKASEVRKRLGLYYGSAGAGDAIRIELPAGTYVPEFRVLPEAAHPIPDTTARHWPPHIMRVAVITAVLLVIGSAAAYSWVRTHSNNTNIVDQFWAPVLEGSNRVSLCAAWVPVYAPVSDRVPPKTLADFIQLPDQFVGGGDLIAISQLSAMLTRMGRPYRVRLGSDVSFEDLRQAPAVLVGYSYTRWKEISDRLRYVIETSDPPVRILDNGKPTKWALAGPPPDRHVTEDYAIVTRVFHPDTHAMLVEIAGITQYGTQAAADLVTNPDLLTEALRHASPDWRHKNMQLVLHVRVIAGAPTAPRLAATYFW